MKKRSWYHHLLLALGIAGGLLLLSFLVMDFTYEVNDDITMVAILNGTYTGTPDAHAVFLKYPLSWFISLLYRTGIPIGWYLVVMMGIYLLAMASLLYRLLERMPRHLILACALFLGGMCTLWLLNIMSFTFTTCGAFVAGSLVLGYALQPKETDLRPGRLVNVLLLYLLSYCLRDYFGYLATAFLGVIWLAKYWRELRDNRRCWLIPLAACLTLGAAAGIHQFGYRDWGDFLAYNDARCYLQDYKNFPDYEEHKEMIQALGYDEREYYTISHYDYCLLPEFSPEVIHQLSDYAHSLEPQRSLTSTVKRAVKRTVNYYFVDDLSELTPLVAASYLLPAALLVVSVFLSLRDKKGHLVFPMLILFGIGCCWLVIGYQGRYPNRVAASLRILTAAASLAGFALLFRVRPIQIKGEQARRRWAAGAAALCLVLAGWGFLHARLERGAPYQGQMEYVSYITQYPENIYLRDTRSTEYDNELLAEYPKLDVKVISTGGWTAYSPLYEQKLAAAGLERVNRDTLFLDNAYLIVRDNYALYKVLGVSKDAQLDYDVVKEFDDGIRILKFYSIVDK